MNDKQFLKEIGDRVYARRTAMRLTQEEVAELMDVSSQMISNLELGKKAIRIENLIKLCKVLNISSDYLLNINPYNKDTVRIAQKVSFLTPNQQRSIEDLIDSLIES